MMVGTTKTLMLFVVSWDTGETVCICSAYIHTYIVNNGLFLQYNCPVSILITYNYVTNLFYILYVFC